MGPPRGSKSICKESNGERKQKIENKREEELYKNHQRFGFFLEEKRPALSGDPDETKIGRRRKRKGTKNKRRRKEKIKRIDEKS